MMSLPQYQPISPPCGPDGQGGNSQSSSELLWSDKKNREEWFLLEENREEAYRFGLQQVRTALTL
jgi:hypothetical protein